MTVGALFCVMRRCLPVVLPASLFAAMLISGCGVTPKSTIDRRAMAVIYDPEITAKAAEGDSPFAQHFRDLHERYRDSLDEPVSVVRWEPSRSTWQVLYATNRAATLSDGRVVGFGNELSSEPTFGASLVELPGGKRGSDRPQASRGKLSFASFLSGGKAKDEENVVKLPQIETWERPAFGQQLASMVERSPQRDVLIFVHGFNVDWESAMARTAQIALDLPFNGAICCYGWPSQGGVRSYGDDETINARSVPPFTSFLQTVIQSVPSGTKINIVVHSMGNRLVMQGVNALPKTSTKPLTHVVLCAPDVGEQDFRDWIDGVRERAEKVTVYTSSGDIALAASRALHGEYRAGQADAMLDVSGIEVIDCSKSDFTFMGHSYYGNNVDVLADLFALIKEHLPPSERGWLKQKDPDDPTQWVLDGIPTQVLWAWHFEDSVTPER